ncbi:hypothetical protein LguiB_020526 [Lonicera macranthoides]
MVISSKCTLPRYSRQHAHSCGNTLGCVSAVESRINPGTRLKLHLPSYMLHLHKQMHRYPDTVKQLEAALSNCVLHLHMQLNCCPTAYCTCICSCIVAQLLYLGWRLRCPVAVTHFRMRATLAQAAAQLRVALAQATARGNLREDASDNKITFEKWFSCGRGCDSRCGTTTFSFKVTGEKVSSELLISKTSQGLIDAYSDLISETNPDYFLDLEGVFLEEVDLEELEEGEIPGF